MVLNLSCGFLGPLLSLCYVNDIFKTTKLATFLVANDTACLAEHENLTDLINFATTELNKLAVRFKANRIAVNVERLFTDGLRKNAKTPMLFFSRAV